MVFVYPTEDCTPELFETVYQMVTNGGQIKLDEDILKKNISNSKFIALWEEDNKFVGISVIKVPQRSYKRKVFEKAGVPDAKEDFEYEIGYCVTLPDYSGRGICQSLILALMDRMPDTNFFATTKSIAMKRIFEKIGFKQLGDPYPVEGADEFLELWIWK